MCLIIQANKMGRGELVSLLKEQHDKFDYLIVSDWRDIHFVPFNPDHPAISGSYTGRAFGKEVELRWRRSEDGECFLCRWISDNGQKFDDWDVLPELSELTSSNLTGYLLWGLPLQLPDNGLFWYQARIPRKLKYPVEWKDPEDKTPLALFVREYKRKGQTLFDRFTELKPYAKNDRSKKEGKA